LISSRSRAIAFASFSVTAEEQVEATFRVANTTYRVQPRREDEPDATRRQLTTFEARRVDERAKPDVPRLRHEPETVANQDAVFTTERCDVSDGRQRHQVQHVERHVRPRTMLFQQRERQLERHGGGAEILVRVFAPRHPRIEHGHTFRRRFARQVVVRDDDVDAATAEVRDSVVRRRAAVARHQQRGSSGDRGAYAGLAKVVAVGEAVRRKRDGVGAELPQACAP
jgi:hypothetical protein